MLSQERISELQTILKDDFGWTGDLTKTKELGEFLVNYISLLINNNTDENI
jgi:hypothetical protein